MAVVDGEEISPEQKGTRHGSAFARSSGSRPVPVIPAGDEEGVLRRRSASARRRSAGIGDEVRWDAVGSRVLRRR